MSKELTHVTRVTAAGDVYGHDVKGCDPAGCAGHERLLPLRRCAICASHGWTDPLVSADTAVEIERDEDRDGLGTGRVFACPDCVRAGETINDGLGQVAEGARS